MMMSLILCVLKNVLCLFSIHGALMIECLLCLTFNLKALFVKTNCCRVVAFQLLLILLVVDEVNTSAGF